MRLRLADPQQTDPGSRDSSYLASIDASSLGPDGTLWQVEPSFRKWAPRFLDLARHVSEWSKDPSTKCGAVIVRPDKSICSVGFNGFPQGMPDDPATYANREEKYSRVVHCEVNALLFAREPVQGYTLYTFPFLSCDRCFVQMVQAGIRQFVAPIASNEAAERWGPAFERVRQYAQEMHIDIVEIER